MVLEHKRLDEISEEDLHELIVGAVAEGKEIDFKREAYGNSDSDRREFLADVSSFANTAGGHIIIGMEEAQGVAARLCGLSQDPDAERLRLEQVARNGLQPRLIGLQIHVIQLASGGHALIVRVPRSWNPPHRVVAQTSNRFFCRDGGGKFEPDVEQLRKLFHIAPTIAEKLWDFRLDRIAKIAARETPRALIPGGAAILHVAPFVAIDAPSHVSVSDLNSLHSHFRPMGASGYRKRINLDGLITSTGDDDRECSAYTQTWRNGRIEAARAPLVRDRNEMRIINSRILETHLVDGVVSYLSGLRLLDIPPPYAILVSLTGVKGALLDAPDAWSDYGEHAFDRDVIAISEVLITEALDDDREVPLLLKPIFDEIANAAGLFASRNFDKEGNWRGTH